MNYDDDMDAGEEGDAVPPYVANESNAELARDEAGGFESLRKPGANGLLSVLASLYFWGSAVKASGKKSRRWLESVDDCAYVLSRLASTA